MEKHLIALKLCLISGFSIASCASSYAQTTAQLPGGCSFGISIQKANEFVDGQMAEYAKRSEAVLDEVQEIKDRAQRPDVINPDVGQGELLNQEDINTLNDLRRQLISIAAEKNVVNNYKRDVQVIAETYRVATLVDLYGVKKEDLGDADPRKFYFEILVRLRVSQPGTSETPRTGQENNCDPERGLVFEEAFNRQQFQRGRDKRFANLIFDIERLRTLYNLYRNLLIGGIADVRATTSSGDAPTSPGNIQSYIAASSAAIQSMYRTIVPYIDQQFPSDGSFEQAFHPTTKEQAEGKK